MNSIRTYFSKHKNLLPGVIVLFFVIFLITTVSFIRKQQVYRNYAATSNPYTGIHVVGNKFENGLGQVIHVHGTNVTQMFYGNAGVCNTINNQTIDAISTWNINWVRLWISANDWLNNTNCGGGVTYQTAVMNNIHRIETDGMIAEATFVSDTPLDSNGHTAGLSNLGLQFWTSFAPFIASEPAVALDLINEPVGTADSASGWKCLFQGMSSGTCNQGAGANWNGAGQYQYIGYNQVITVIRSAGFTGPIGTPGTNYARGATGFQTWAPVNAGIYLPYHEYGAYSTAPALLTQLAVNWNQFPVLLEEFQGSSGNSWLDTVMQGIDSGQGVGYSVWQWGNDGSDDGLQVVQPDTCATCYFGTGQDYHDYIATQPSLSGAGVTTTPVPTFTPTPTLMPGATSAIYTDSLATNWVDWSWADVDNLANTSPVFSGTNSIAFSLTSGFAGLYLHNTVGINTQPYFYLHFAAQASQAGQQYQVAIADSANNFLSLVPLTNFGGNPTIGKWTIYNIPLINLSATNQTISGFVIQDTTGNPEPNLYVDDISLTNPTLTPTAGPTPTNSPTPVPSVTPSSTLTNTPMPTNTPVPNSATLSLTVGLDGIGKAGDNVNRTSTGNLNPLHPMRTVTLTLSDQNNTVLPSFTGQVTYDSTSGLYKGIIQVPTTIASGVYLLKVATPSYLQRTIANILTLSHGQMTTVPTLYLTAGDINNDGQISLLDYNIILGCFGTTSPSWTTTCASADLDDNGNVGGSDYNLFLRELSVQNGG